jgi:hypothetical protein
LGVTADHDPSFDPPYPPTLWMSSVS